MSRPNLILWIAILTILNTSIATAKEDRSDRSWMNGFTLIQLNTDDVESLHSARAYIQSRGGRIAIMSPPSLLMGWVSVEMRADLIGKAGIQDIYFTEVLPGEIQTNDSQTRHMLDYFNGVVRGEYEEDIRSRVLASPQSDNEWSRASDHDGLLVDEPFDVDAYRQNLRDNGFDIRQLKDKGVLLGEASSSSAGNSDRMMGTVTATLIFVESDGSGVDPNSYTWTNQHVQDYVAGVNTGLAWWSAQSYNYTGCWVAFFVRYIDPTDARCQQWREMVLHPSGDVAGMASDVMAKFGFSSGSHFSRVNAFNSAQRITYGTDWAYTGFVAYNPEPAPSQLSDAKSAFAYRFGPYTFLLYRSFSWAVDQVFTHESGHIFGACDEYAASGCSCASICANGTLNANCATCSSSLCMMKANSFVLCDYTDEHLGWQLSPCAPATLAPPVVISVDPTSAIQGQSISVTVLGSDYLFDASASFGPGITITSTTLLGSNVLQLTIDIDNETTTGARNVTVSNRDLQSGVLGSGFTILASTRHYVSATGADVFPYLTPAEAATAFTDAFNVAETGDSVYVIGGPVALTSLIVNKGVCLLGGWDATFTNRDPLGTPTILSLGGNIVFGNGIDVATIDGFILSNGHGSIGISPVPGDYGGAMKIVNSTVVIKNCELYDNKGSQGLGYSAGGAIAASESEITLQNVNVHDNTANVGGAVYLYKCTGSMTDCSVTSNNVVLSTQSPAGGGIYLDQCGVWTISNLTLNNNSGARDGGGMMIQDSGPIHFQGGDVSNNSSSFNGGGVHIVASTVDFDATMLSRNTGIIGGGISSTDTSAITIGDVTFLWNSALIGGGIYATSGSFFLDHSLFVGNAGSSSGGALSVGNISAGVINGNTFDRNSSGGTGGISVTETSMEIFNNIISNTTGDGVFCGGTTLPNLLRNLVTSSSGTDYVGCSAGVGSGSWSPSYVDTANGDYHLGAHSGAIDEGRDGGAFDDPDGSPGDMGIFGAYSFVMDQPSFVQNLNVAVVGGNVLLDWNASPELDVAQYAVYCDTVSGFKPSLANFVGFITAPDTSANVGALSDSTFYSVNAVDSDGYAGGYSNEVIASLPTSISGFSMFADRLYQNIPNPFNPSTLIRFETARAGDVRLVIYDVSGRVIRSLLQGRMPSGLHTTAWNGLNAHGVRVSSGVYFYKLHTDRTVRTRKMILLK